MSCPFTRSRALVPATLVWACAVLVASSRADVIELAGGGQLEGQIVQSDEGDKTTFVIDLSGGGRVSVPRSAVTRVDSVNDAEAEYRKLARSSPDTVAAHTKLAEWCRQHKLAGDGHRHLERILELDPNHAEARAALGFRQKDGKWMNRDDVMAARGLVLYEGKYVTPQHVELMQQQKEVRTTQADWTKRVEQLRRWLTGKRPDQAAQAQTEILEIRDPTAAEAVVKALRGESDADLRRLWLEVAARLNSRVAVDALVDLSLNDEEDDFRQRCVEYLIESRRPGISTPYVRALSNKDNVIVNRAGDALGQIKDRDTTGALIDALITKHKFKTSDVSPDQYSTTFSKEGGGGFSFGGGGPQYVTQAVRNRDVLDALLTMSDGVNFEYDQEGWRGWLAAQAKANAVDVRRDR